MDSNSTGKNKKKILINTTNKSCFNSQLFRRLRLERPYSNVSDSYRLHMSKHQVGLKIGKSEPQITRYESGEQNPSLEALKKICLLFQIDPKDLMGLIWISATALREGETISLDGDNKNLDVKIKICPRCKHLELEVKPYKAKKHGK